MTKYPNLFSPLKINSVMAMNRIMVSPMGCPQASIISSTNYGGVSVYDKSLGGAGVMHVNNAALAGASNIKTMDPFEKYARDASREVLSVLRQAGSLSSTQMFFFGEQREDKTSMMPCDGMDIKGNIARAMTIEEIHRAQEDLVRRCIETKNFGFDMIMLHFAHDSLTSLFLSPVWNKRNDEYGGSLENRCRITVEAAKAVREAVGPNYPLMMRVSRNLWVEETFDEDDMVFLCKQLEPYIDLVNVSYSMDCYGGTIDKYEANVHMSTMTFEPHLYNLPFCERLKKETKMLVVPIGAIETPEEAEEAIASGKCDAVMLGRAMVADPFWPKKAMEGRSEDIVPCLRCGHCYHISTVHENVQCSVNPRFRRENRVPLKLEKTDNPKKVVIIGGGPAGCKAALTASEKGHHVILLEKTNRLGGQINISDYSNHKEDLRRYRDYLLTQVNKDKNIETKLNFDANYDSVKAFNPDAIIIAIGAKQMLLDYKGIENTIDVVEAYHNIDLLKGNIVIIGGGSNGCEIALDLAERKQNVTIIHRSDVLARKGNWLYRLALGQHLKAQETLSIKYNSKVKEISKNEVVYYDENGNELSIKADHIINTVGMQPKTNEAHSFYGITPQTYMVGDCYKVARVLEATNDSYFIASNI